MKPLIKKYGELCRDNDPTTMSLGNYLQTIIKGDKEVTNIPAPIYLVLADHIKNNQDTLFGLLGLTSEEENKTTVSDSKPLLKEQSRIIDELTLMNKKLVSIVDELLLQVPESVRKEISETLANPQKPSVGLNIRDTFFPES